MLHVLRRGGWAVSVSSCFHWCNLVTGIPKQQLSFMYLVPCVPFNLIKTRRTALRDGSEEELQKLDIRVLRGTHLTPI